MILTVSTYARKFGKFVTLGVFLGTLVVSPLGAQPQRMRGAVAVRGEPFGVVLAEVPLPPDGSRADLRILVDDAGGRLFYPAVAVREIEVVERQESGRLIGGGALIDRLRTAVRGGPQRRKVAVAITVAALYRGDAPLELHLIGDIDQRIRIDSSPNSPVAHRELLSTWWDAYTKVAKQSVAEGDHPTLVHKYLCTMLSQRHDFPAIDLDPPKDGKQEPLVEPLNTLSLLSAIEPLRDNILDEVLTKPSDLSVADQPIPLAPRWLDCPAPVLSSDLPIETLAYRIPPECFYLRFGSFANYVWFQDVSSRHGGDMAQMLLLRGFNYETSARMERMLSTKMTAVSKMFGDKVISDMAVIGRDLYMKEGASLGVVFACSNANVLISAMESERKAALGKISGATLQKLNLSGKEVSLLSTPDNRVRSFLVRDGQYVLLATSRALAERFIQVSGGEPSLAASGTFRAARHWMPDANQYSVFGFFSPEFFHGLVSPQYQIELRRRLEAIACLELAEVATQAARAEGVPTSDIDSLKRAGLLPTWFDARADGAKCLSSDDSWIDSLRGARGSFLPIADVNIQHVTRAEAARYTQLASFYQTKWQQMDPLLVGLRRFQAQENPNQERVAFEAYVAPIASQKYGWVANLLAPPSLVEIRLPDDDVASVQLHMRGTSIVAGARPDYHLFAGVKDMIPPPPEDTKGLIRTFRALKAVPAYIGAWPMPGFLDSLPLGIGGGRPDFAGFSKMLIVGLWRCQSNGFSLLSFDRGILEHVIPQLQPKTAPDSAQARLRVSNLRGSKLAGWVNQQWYERAWKASRGNARLLDAIHQQLKVPGEQSLAAAERLLDVRLQCPLGGKYEFVPSPISKNIGWWISSAWSRSAFSPDGSPVLPPDYVAPWLTWFRGGRVHLTQMPERLALVGLFDLELPPATAENAAVSLPELNFDLFQLPFKLFGSDSAKAKEPERRTF